MPSAMHLAGMLDFRPVLYVVGLLLGAIAVAMALPAAVDASDGNSDWQVFVSSAIATGFVGGVLALSNRPGGHFAIDVRQGFLLTTSAWIACAGFSALPFVFCSNGLDYAGAFFESMSGFTTTGSTAFASLAPLARGILLWRSLIQWFGGVGIVVVAIILLPFLRVGGMQLFRTESSDRSEKVTARPGEMVTYILGTYVLLSAACALAFWLAGMSGFDAVNYAMATLATGGFSTYDDSFAHFGQPAIAWIGTIFMCAGALPFTAYIRSVAGRGQPLWRDSQVRGFVGFLVVVSLGVALWLAVDKGMPLGPALRHSFFNVTSVVTTTGFASTDYQLWGAPAVGLFLILTFVGGCTGSTGGGIKIFRFQVLWIMTRAYFRQLIRPHTVAVIRYNGRRIPDDVPYSVLAFVVAYIGIVVALTLALTADGLDLVTALSGAATALGNVGPGLGRTIGPAGNFSSLPDTAKWLLSLGMLLGRLELFTVLVLLQRGFWRW